MNRKYIILMITVCLLSVANLSAQYKHEISVNAFGGFSGLNYKSDLGDQKNGYGYGGGLTYVYLFKPLIGLGFQTGFNITMYNSEIDMENLSGSSLAYDGVEEFDFRYTLKDVVEKQQAMYLNIPVMLYYETYYTNKLYFAGGVKVGIPISGKATIDNAALRTSGYYPNINAELYAPAFMGFGNFDINADNDLKLKPAFSAAFEVGVKWRVRLAKRGELARRAFIHTSFYVDYALNNVKKDNASDMNLITYNTDNPSDFKIENSLLNQDAVTEKIHPFSVGLKVSIAMGVGEKFRRIHMKDVMWP